MPAAGPAAAIPGDGIDVVWPGVGTGVVGFRDGRRLGASVTGVGGGVDTPSNTTKISTFRVRVGDTRSERRGWGSREISLRTNTEKNQITA